jgi:hypothetical protein
MTADEPGLHANPWRESPAELADRLRAEHADWTINAHPLGLGLWTAEKRSEDGRSVHYLVTHTGTELAERLAAIDGPSPRAGSGAS